MLSYQLKASQTFIDVFIYVADKIYSGMYWQFL